MQNQDGSIQAPSLIISASFHRSGSTWLQRMITDSTDIFVWGEDHDLTANFSDYYHRIKNTDSLNNRTSQQHTPSFIENVTPEFNQLKYALKQFYSSYYQVPSFISTELACHKYGFKEVRYGKTEIEFLLQLFTDTKIILLVRNIYDVVRSVKGHSWLKEQNPIKGFFTLPEVCIMWAKRSMEYLNLKHPNCYFLKYEDCAAKINDILKFIVGKDNFSNDKLLNNKIGTSSTKLHSVITDEELEQINFFAGDAIASLGYELIIQT